MGQKLAKPSEGDTKYERIRAIQLNLLSLDCCVSGEASWVLGGLTAKSIESSGAPGTLLGGLAIVRIYYLNGMRGNPE